MQAAKLIKEDDGRLNERLMRRFGQVDLSRIESATRPIAVTLASPEAKRIFMRFFNVMQVNVHYVSVISRMHLPNAEIEQHEQHLLHLLELVDRRVNKELASAEQRLKQAGVTQLASYQIHALSAAVPVYSRYGRRYLELLCKFDHLMLMLETMALDELIGISDQAVRKANLKRAVRSVAAAALSMRIQLHKKINPELHRRGSNGDTLALRRALRDAEHDTGESDQAGSGADLGASRDSRGDADGAAEGTADGGTDGMADEDGAVGADLAGPGAGERAVDDDGGTGEPAARSVAARRRTTRHSFREPVPAAPSTPLASDQAQPDAQSEPAAAGPVEPDLVAPSTGAPHTIAELG